ncbi:MAG: SsrA-binding protein SmpB [Mycoplasmataceae bacterium]|nr:SsrA-binding protein SmpB [Mycoplasmataceae bacterium]
MAKVISKNKDAFFNFEILDRFEAGIELKGWEVKSIREGNVNLRGAFCSFRGTELFVSNMNISLYMNVPGDSTAPRKLLLHKQQLKKLREATKVKGHSIVATTLKWSSKGLVKLDIGIGKGKTKTDKRQTIKKRDSERINKKYI